MSLYAIQKFLILFMIIKVVISFNKIKEEKEWSDFKLQFNKNYDEFEDKYRQKLFERNKLMIAEHNTLHEQGLSTFHLGANQFSDWSSEEIRMRLFPITTDNYAYIEEDIPKHKLFMPSGIPMVTEKDWRKEGAVTSVKENTFCHAEYAFGAISGLESAHFITNGKLIELSEQQLIDCSDEVVNQCCHGGFVNIAYDSLIEMGGVESNNDYRRTHYCDSCSLNESQIVAQVDSYNFITTGSEDQLAAAVLEGPVTVIMDNDHDSFLFYKGGIYFERKCKPNHQSHVITVVGFAPDYWILKNYWGIIWGENGYMRIARNKSNHCGIANGGVAVKAKKI